MQFRDGYAPPIETWTEEERASWFKRVAEIRELALVQKVDGLLVQEWELVTLCDAALKQKNGDER